MLPTYKKSKSGLLLPKNPDVGVKCKFCGKIIWKDEEAGGRLFLANGKPICAVCRIRRGNNWRRIEHEVAKKRPVDIERREKIEQDKANEQVQKLASDTIRETGTAIKK